MEKISEIIRREMLNSSDSMRTLAERSGVDVSQLSRFAREERTLSQNALDSLCEALGLTLVERKRRKR